MTAIATYVVVVVIPLIVVYVVFQALVRGVPEDRDYEIEVKLCPPSIRRTVSASKSDLVPNGLKVGSPDHEEGERNNAPSRGANARKGRFFKRTTDSPGS